MRRLIILLALLVPVGLMAAEQTVSFKVAGNCGSCKKKIVKAAESVDGLDEAEWDKKTKVFTATFDSEKTNKDAIVKAILASGYDVEDKKGDDKAYEKLPNCCKYRDGGGEH